MYLEMISGGGAFRLSRRFQCSITISHGDMVVPALDRVDGAEGDEAVVCDRRVGHVDIEDLEQRGDHTRLDGAALATGRRVRLATCHVDDRDERLRRRWVRPSEAVGNRGVVGRRGVDTGGVAASQ